MSFCISNKGYKICSSFFNSFLLEKTNFPKAFLLISPSIFNKPLTFFENEFTIWALTFFSQKAYLFPCLIQKPESLLFLRDCKLLFYQYQFFRNCNINWLFHISFFASLISCLVKFIPNHNLKASYFERSTCLIHFELKILFFKTFHCPGFFGL